MMVFRSSDCDHLMSATQQLEATLRAQGERITIQRRLVMQALIETGAHMTIDAINQHIQQRQAIVPLAEPTVYRILQWLKGLGYVSQTDMAEAGIVYQIISAQKHHHLVCLNCDRTTEIDDDLFDNLRQQLLQRYGFQARIDHMAIYGYCVDCDEDDD